MLSCGLKRLLLHEDGKPNGYECDPFGRGVLKGTREEAVARALEVAAEHAATHAANLHRYRAESCDARYLAYTAQVLEGLAKPVEVIDYPREPRPAPSDG